jgi:uncharacterized protein YbjT (DUF2867 family)
MNTTPWDLSSEVGARVLVLGASGQLGQAVVARLAQDNYRVRAFQRRPLADEAADGVEVFLGDALDRDAVARSAEGQDAVVNAIGSGTLRANTVESDTTAAVVAVLQRTGPQRYVGMSAGLVADVSFIFDHLIRPLVLGNLYREHLAVERLIRQSDLDWTIVRPTRLVNAPARGYLESTDRLPRRTMNTSRADVAAFIAKELREGRYLHQAVFLASKRSSQEQEVDGWQS